MNVTKHCPTLINCLAKGSNGFYLDLALPSDDLSGAAESVICTSPFSKTIRARINTDGDDLIRHVHLVLQKDQLAVGPDANFLGLVVW